MRTGPPPSPRWRSIRSTSAAETGDPMPTPMARENGERTPWETASPPAAGTAAAPAPRAARVRSSWRACASSMRRASSAGLAAGLPTGALPLGLHAQLREHAAGAGDLARHPEHVPDVDLDGAGVDRVEEQVGGDGLVGPVEEEPHELALRVQDRRPGVAAGGVHVGEEVHRYV